jgi:hypothetical protein
MANVQVELNSEGIRELLRSQAMMEECRAHAQAIASRAGGGYTVTTYTGVTRVNASVMTATPEAIKDNLKNNTLLKAVR